VQDLLASYLPIIIFLGIAVALGIVLMLSAIVIAVRNPDPEKNSVYECGFNAFDDARMKFDVRFYLVSILFIIFDLGNRVPVPVGRGLWRYVDGRVLVDDAVLGGADRGLCL
jgi:NADH:ubiquinone oxidoreductase subunit 3 (subunit A)